MVDLAILLRRPAACRITRGAVPLCPIRAGGYDLGAMSVLVLTVVILLLLPVAVLAAMAVRLGYDDWSDRRALREETTRAEALRQAATSRHLVALDGDGSDPAHEERRGKTA
jgi:hypothetical protein